MIFAKLPTETLPSKNPKNPENKLETWYSNENFFNNDDMLYIVEKVLQSSIQ